MTHEAEEAFVVLGGRLWFVGTNVIGQIPMMIVGSRLISHTADDSANPAPKDSDC